MLDVLDIFQTTFHFKDKEIHMEKNLMIEGNYGCTLLYNIICYIISHIFLFFVMLFLFVDHGHMDIVSPDHLSVIKSNVCVCMCMFSSNKGETIPYRAFSLEFSTYTTSSCTKMFYYFNFFQIIVCHTIENSLSAKSLED